MPNDTTQPPGRTQIGPEYFLKRYRDIGDKEHIVDKAKAAWKADIQVAKSTGINVKALKLVDKLRGMDPRDAQSLIRDTILYLRWLGLNILDQEELIDDGPSTAGMTSYIVATHAAWEARKAGYAAGKKGRPVDSNPFAPGSETHQRWASEWLDGHADAESLAPPGNKDIQPHNHDGENPEDADDRLP